MEYALDLPLAQALALDAVGSYRMGAHPVEETYEERDMLRRLAGL